MSLGTGGRRRVSGADEKDGRADRKVPEEEGEVVISYLSQTEVMT